MAYPTPVNDQITDATTQGNVTVIGEAPGMALATLCQTMAQVIGIGMHNTATSHQQTNELATAVLTRCISSLTSE